MHRLQMQAVRLPFSLTRKWMYPEVVFSTTDTKLPVSKKFTATILWMDDEELTVGKDYLVKLGTTYHSGYPEEYPVQD